MSLINKVLRDLESQRDSASERRDRSPIVDQGLRSVRRVKSRLSRQQLIRIATALGFIAVSVYAWNQWGAVLLERSKTAPAPGVTAPVAVSPATDPKTATPTVAAKPPAEPAKSVAPERVTKTATPSAKPDTPAPSSTETGMPVTPSAKPLPDIVVRKPKVVSAKPEAPAVAAAPESPAEPVKEKAEAPIPEETLPTENIETLPEKPKEAPKPAPEKPVGKVVLEKKVKPLSPTDKAENEYRLAASSLQQKRTGETEAHLRAALAAQPTHVKARELLAGLLLQGGRWREAQSLLEQGVNQSPTYYPFAQLLARSYVDHGQEKKALELIEKSRDAAGTDPEYFAFLATLYQRSGRHGDAVTSFNEAVSLRPQEGRWWLGLAISLEATEQWKAAGEAYQRAADSGTLDRQLFQYARQRLTTIKNK